MKKVKFNTIQRIVYIPDKKDMIYTLFHNDLWWSENDYQQFTQSSMIEITRLLQIHQNMSISDAKKLLYQPHNLRYDETNFDFRMEKNQSTF